MANNETRYEIIRDLPGENTIVHKKKRGRRFVFWCIFTCAVFVICDFILLLFFGKIWFVNPMKKEYHIMGINVSSKQGKIAWDAIAMQNIDFAFIRATEGKSLVDTNFRENFDNAYASQIDAAPLHDLTFSSSGAEQAEAFIKAVGDKKDRQLPPVVQIRLYGKYVAVPPKRQEVADILKDFCQKIKDKYGCAPIIMTDEKLYEKYIFGDYSDSKLCIRSVYSKPNDENQSFMFWLYNPKTRLNGCETDEYMDKITILKSENEYYDMLF